MKGIIMAGGCGTRLYPTTKIINKTLLPVYDKPMIYYPLSLLLMAGVREILLVLAERELTAYRELLGDGSRYGICIRYAVEEQPLGTCGAFLLGRDFIGDEAFALALGDNIFFGQGLADIVKSASERFEINGGAQIFCRHVEDPRDFGVVEFDSDGGIRTLESKPQNPKSHYAVTGLFFFDPEVTDLAKADGQSEGALVEFPLLLKNYLACGRLHSVILDEDIQWFDAGTPQRLFDASAAVRTFQESRGQYAGCLEGTAFECGLIDRERLSVLSAGLLSTEYGRHLQSLAEGKSKL